MFPTGGDNPEGRVMARDFVNLGVPGFFLIREVDVTLERGRLDPEAQTVIEELNKTVKAVVGRFVAPVNQRIATIDLLCLRIIVRQRPRPAIGAFQRDAARGSGSWRSQWQLSLADFRGVGTAWRLGNAGPFGYSALWRRTRAEAVAGPRVVCPARQSLSLISLPRSPQGAECLLPALLAAV